MVTETIYTPSDLHSGECEWCGKHPLITSLPMRYPKRRANLLYKLRRKGIEDNTKQRVIFIPYGQQPQKYIQALRLCREFHFNIQYIIT